MQWLGWRLLEPVWLLRLKMRWWWKLLEWVLLLLWWWWWLLLREVEEQGLLDRREEALHRAWSIGTHLLLLLLLLHYLILISRAFVLVAEEGVEEVCWVLTHAWEAHILRLHWREGAPRGHHLWPVHGRHVPREWGHGLAMGGAARGHGGPLSKSWRWLLLPVCVLGRPWSSGREGRGAPHGIGGTWLRGQGGIRTRGHHVGLALLLLPTELLRASIGGAVVIETLSVATKADLLSQVMCGLNLDLKQ